MSAVNQAVLRSDAQCPHFVALSGTLIKQCGQSLTVAAAAGAGLFKRFMSLITRKIANATITKSMIVLMNAPYLIATAGVDSVASLSVNARLEKSTLPTK
jgi:hypothetical protein